MVGFSSSNGRQPNPYHLAVIVRSVLTLGATGNIDLFARRDIYLAQNPDRFGMPLYITRREAFRRNPDGTTVGYGAFGARGERFETSSILTHENSGLCMDKTDHWSGRCSGTTFAPDGQDGGD